MQSVSIIIPAHNEATVIARLIDCLVAGVEDYGFQIIVVCNACSDDTAQIVSERSNVLLVETDTPSKTNALNLGDLESLGTTRVYMDADVVMSANHVQVMLRALDEPGVEVVVPRIQMNFLRSSWYVKAYYDIWLSLPYVKEGIMGGGVYALSQAGRERFGTFPDIISDDGFVMGQFSNSEIKCVTEAVSMVTPPRTLPGLIKIKTRSRYGLYQLFETFPELQSNHAKSYANPIFEMAKTPANWAKMIVYLGINLYCKYRAKMMLNSRQEYRWETDTSSRS